MLIRENTLNDTSVRMGVIMSDLRILMVSATGSFLEIARQANALGTGLQNAAPGDKAGTPNSSVQYLLKISEVLTELAKQLENSHAAEISAPKSGPGI
jgi:hypothetical protein